MPINDQTVTFSDAVTHILQSLFQTGAEISIIHFFVLDPGVGAEKSGKSGSNHDSFRLRPDSIVMF